MAAVGGTSYTLTWRHDRPTLAIERSSPTDSTLLDHRAPPLPPPASLTWTDYVADQRARGFEGIVFPEPGHEVLPWNPFRNPGLPERPVQR